MLFTDIKERGFYTFLEAFEDLSDNYQIVEPLLTYELLSERWNMPIEKVHQFFFECLSKQFFTIKKSEPYLRLKFTHRLIVKSGKYTIKEPIDPEIMTIISDVITYYNQEVGTNIRQTSATAITLIKGRITDNQATIEDFKTVIDNKVADWIDNEKMRKFLRMETIFSKEKFEGYLNQSKIKGNSTNKSNNQPNAIKKQNPVVDFL